MGFVFEGENDGVIKKQESLKKALLFLLCGKRIDCFWVSAVCHGVGNCDCSCILEFTIPYVLTFTSTISMFASLIVFCCQICTGIVICLDGLYLNLIIFPFKISLHFFAARIICSIFIRFVHLILYILPIIPHFQPKNKPVSKARILCSVQSVRPYQL